MAITSADVAAQDDIMAADHNTLRADLLTGDVTIAGIKTFSSSPVFSAGITAVTITTGIITTGTITDLTVSNSQTIGAAKKLYFGVGADTFIEEAIANSLRITAGGALSVIFGAATCQFQKTLSIEAGQDFQLDGGIGNDYITRSGAGIVDYYVGGAIMLRMDSDGIAPGDADSLKWDIVAVALDGMTPDYVAYAIDSTVIKGLQTVVENVSGPNAHHISDKSETTYNYVAHQLDATFIIHYGGSYVANDVMHILIHHT